MSNQFRSYLFVTDKKGGCLNLLPEFRTASLFWNLTGSMHFRNHSVFNLPDGTRKPNSWVLKVSGSIRQIFFYRVIINTRSCLISLVHKSTRKLYLILHIYLAFNRLQQ